MKRPTASTLDWTDHKSSLARHRPQQRICPRHSTSSMKHSGFQLLNEPERGRAQSRQTAVHSSSLLQTSANVSLAQLVKTVVQIIRRQKRSRGAVILRERERREKERKREGVVGGFQVHSSTSPSLSLFFLRPFVHSL